jgi:hypothetical protein
LQAVFKSVNWVTQKLASQLFELLNYLAGNTALHNFVLLSEIIPIFFRRLGKRTKRSSAWFDA